MSEHKKQNKGEPFASVKGMRDIIDERIKLDIVHGRDLPRIRADKRQLETALTNLATNARDAMTEGGQLLIDIDNHGSGEAAADEGAGDGDRDGLLVDIGRDVDVAVGVHEHVAGADLGQIGRAHV